MTLRDRMIYAGLRTSRKFAKLTWRERDFFSGLLHVADDYGRFEADAELLREVLYGVIRDRVSKRDVAEMLVRVYQVGLVKLYTQSGRGYGKVINFRQHGLKTRRALYPDEDGPPDDGPDLFTNGVALYEGRKEAPHSPPPAGGGNASLWESKPAVRFRRAQRLDTLHEERERLEEEMRAILRPGGCAYNVQPTGEKAKRLNDLRAAHERVQEVIRKRREELASESMQ